MWRGTSPTAARTRHAVLAVYQREARTTGSYERLVRFLVESQQLEAAERSARVGIEHTRENLPGITSALARSLCDVARQRRAWDVVAAHAAWLFFANPSEAAFYIRASGQ